MDVERDTYPEDNRTQDYYSSPVPAVTEPAESSDTFDIPMENIIVPVLFSMVFIVGIVGNSVLIYTVVRNRKMRIVPNIYIVSLSLGDLLLVLISVPFNATIFVTEYWPFGNVMCKFNEYLQTVSLGVSVFTLTALSADRYTAIVDPMGKHKSQPFTKALVTSVSIWVSASLLAIPDLVNTRVRQFSSNDSAPIAICLLYKYELPPGWYARAMVMAKFVVYFAVPLLVISVFYSLMARILILSSQQMPGDSQGRLNYQKQIEARKKVAKAVLSFVVLFALCWLPRHVYLLWYYYGDGYYNEFWHAFKITGFCLAFVNSCINPFALYFLSNQFRKYYNRYLFCWCTQAAYNSLEPSSVMYNFQSTIRRHSTSVTFVESQSAC